MIRINLFGEKHGRRLVRFTFLDAAVTEPNVMDDGAIASLVPISPRLTVNQTPSIYEYLFLLFGDQGAEGL